MRRKYGNKKVVIDDIEFDSKAEGDYYLYLKQLLENGTISNLRLQVSYTIIPTVWGEKTVHLKTKTKIVPYCIQKATHYLADFVYIETATGKEHVVDVKGKTAPLTEGFKLKRKMMRAFNNIDVEIVRI